MTTPREDAIAARADVEAAVSAALYDWDVPSSAAYGVMEALRAALAAADDRPSWREASKRLHDAGADEDSGHWVDLASPETAPPLAAQSTDRPQTEAGRALWLRWHATATSPVSSWQRSGKPVNDEYRARIAERHIAQMMVHYTYHGAVIEGQWLPPMNRCVDPMCAEAERALHADIDRFSRPPEVRYYDED